MLPSPKWFGRPEVQTRRSIVHAILYFVRTRCSWRLLPVDFPPWQTRTEVVHRAGHGVAVLKFYAGSTDGESDAIKGGSNGRSYALNRAPCLL